MGSNERINYARVSVILKRCGSSVVNAVLGKRVSDLRPVDKAANEWTLDNLLCDSAGDISKLLDQRRPENRKKKKLLLPEHQSTQLENWDLQLVIWVLCNLCKLETIVKQDLENISNIRNKIAHSTEPIVTDGDYRHFIGRLEGAFTRLMDFVGNELNKGKILGQIELYDKEYIVDSNFVDQMFEWNKETIDAINEKIHDDVRTIKVNTDSVLKSGKENTDAIRFEITEKTKALQKEGKENTETIRTENKENTEVIMAAIQENTTEGNKRIEDMHRMMQDMWNWNKEKVERHNGAYWSGRIPGTKAKIKIENVGPKSVVALSKHLAHKIKTAKKQKTDDTSKDDEIECILEKSLDELLTDGREIIDTGVECVAIYIQCQTIESLMALFDDCSSGQLTSIFKPLEVHLRKTPGYENIELNVVIEESDYSACVTEIFNQLEECYSAELEQAHRLAFSENPLSRIQVESEDIVQYENGIEIELTVNSASFEDKQKFEESVRNGSKRHVFDKLAQVLRERFDSPNLQINLQLDSDHSSNISCTQAIGRATEAKALEPAKAEQIASGFDKENALLEGILLEKKVERTRRERIDNLIKDARLALYAKDHKTAKRCAIEIADIAQKERIELLDDYNPTETNEEISDWFFQCATILLFTEDIFMSTRYFYTAVVTSPDWEDLDIGFVWDRTKFPVPVTLLLKRDEFMQENRPNLINDLIRQGQHSLDIQDHESARRYAIQVQDMTEEDKNKILRGVDATISEQQLAEWLLKCIYIFISTSDFQLSADCFYPAMLFHPQWDIETHQTFARTIWNGLVFSVNNYFELFLLQADYIRLLGEMTKYAAIAVQRQKWALAFSIDRDAITVHEYIKNMIGWSLIDTSEQMLRVLRCLFSMGRYKELTHLCRKTLEDIWEYDNPEAFELWAMALCSTGDYNVALTKCDEGISCKNVSAKVKDRMLVLRSQIEEKLSHTEAAKCQPALEGLSLQKTMVHLQVNAPPVVIERIKKRHRRPKARANDVNTTVIGQKKENQNKSSPVEYIEQIKVSKQRPRHLSESSIASNISYDISCSDTETDEKGEESDSGYASHLTDSSKYEDLSPEDVEAPISIFEQSRRYHQQADLQVSSFTDEDLVKSGLDLSESYLNRINTRKFGPGSQRPFYPDFYPENQLREMLRKSPKKYIRCILQIENSHKAVCKPVETNKDFTTIEISGRSKIGMAFNNDEVVIELLDKQESNDRRYGRIIGVLKPYRKTKHPVFICTLDETETHLARPMCKSVPKINILTTEVKRQFKSKTQQRFKVEIYDYDAKTGTLCNPRIINVNPAGQTMFVFLVAYIAWTPMQIYPKGAIIRMLPCGDSISRGLKILNLQYEVPNMFSKETVKTVDAITSGESGEPDDNTLKGRLDLTKLNTFTIDPLDGEELDTALSIGTCSGGYVVGVHIADISAYVEKGSPVDEEAKARALTFSSGVTLPSGYKKESNAMLPEPLIAKCCSLITNHKRLTLSIFFYLQKNGKPLQMEDKTYKIQESYIRTRRQFTHAELDQSCNAEREDQLSKDVTMLSKLAKCIRNERVKQDIFVKFPEKSKNLGARNNDAVMLFEEFKIMANRKAAYVLTGTFPNCVPLRCQSPPDKGALEAFQKRNEAFIDVVVQLQDRTIYGNERGVYQVLSPEKTQVTNLVVPKSLWTKLKDNTSDTGIKIIKDDDRFPIQHTVLQHWFSLQERESYIRSESSGEMINQATFTSPASRYVDLVVQRLIRASLNKGGKCPYSPQEMDEICIEANLAEMRSTEYFSRCQALQLGETFFKCPQIVHCYANEITEKGITLCSPIFKHVPKTRLKLPFNLLDMGFKPRLIEDARVSSIKVEATWRKRFYDHNPVITTSDISREDTTILNPYTHSWLISRSTWANLLKAALEGRRNDFKKRISTIRVQKVNGVDDVSTECRDIANLQTSTKFRMTFSRGQTLAVQMSASPYKGIVIPTPMLYQMTENVLLCLDHAKDPVSHLYRYATNYTLDHYKTVELYLDIWVPLILMEAAIGAVRNEESCSISGVPIAFTTVESGKIEGKFSLSLVHCETRNIALSGTRSEDPEDRRSENETSFDWLCLKAIVHCPSNGRDHYASHRYWVGHAEIKKVDMKKKDSGLGGKITVTCQLHEKTKAIPDELTHTKCQVEILRKSEVDRRTESFIRKLRHSDDSLATQIALNKPIPELDEDYHNILDRIGEKDLYFETSEDASRRWPLNKNNVRQQEAINNALHNRFTLIQGPPGTGKTYTGIKLIYLFAKINQKQNSRKQVLFCGPSNKSVDLVAKIMCSRLGKLKPKFVRVYGRSIEAKDFPIPGRAFLSSKSTHDQKADEELRDVSLHFLIRQKGKKYAKELTVLDELFKSHKYQPVNPAKVREYVHLIREASIDEIRKHDVILCTTAVGTNPKVLESTKVQQVIIDEAGMCSEPQCLVPIIATKAEQVVLIGDHKQLKPIIMCREAAQLGLDTSLFERYAIAKNNVTFTMLEQQYRMNPRICEFPSKEFYNGSLKTEPGPWIVPSLHIWPHDEAVVYPHVFVHINGEEKVLTVSTEDGNEQSRSNDAEADYVVQLYKYIYRQAKHDTVHILSQYNSQCSEIKRKLEDKKLPSRHVRTVVSSQGGEWDYVIFSTVCSLPEYKIEMNPTLGWCKQNLGFITDKNQVNVALTRARKGLVIVGNKNLLRCDKLWKRLLEDYEAKGCVKSVSEFQPWTYKHRR